MAGSENVIVKIKFINPDFDEEELDEEAQNLLVQIIDSDIAETVSRATDPNPPSGSKAFDGFLAGMLAAEVSPANVKKLFLFLRDRLGNKPIELEVEGNGKKLKVKASSQAELELAVETAQKFLAS